MNHRRRPDLFIDDSGRLLFFGKYCFSLHGLLLVPANVAFLNTPIQRRRRLTRTILGCDVERFAVPVRVAFLVRNTQVLEENLRLVLKLGRKT